MSAKKTGTLFKTSCILCIFEITVSIVQIYLCSSRPFNPFHCACVQSINNTYSRKHQKPPLLQISKKTNMNITVIFDDKKRQEATRHLHKQ